MVLPNNARRTRDRLEQLSRAIRYVYASTFFQAPKTFMEAENVQAEAEQMAVAIQRLVGRSYEDRFYPDFAGVAQSHNYYPVGNLKAEDGLVTVALGLGSTVADGQRCLRFSPARPRVLPQMGSPRARCVPADGVCGVGYGSTHGVGSKSPEHSHLWIDQLSWMVHSKPLAQRMSQRTTGVRHHLSTRRSPG